MLRRSLTEIRHMNLLNQSKCQVSDQQGAKAHTTQVGFSLHPDLQHLHFPHLDQDGSILIMLQRLLPRSQFGFKGRAVRFSPAAWALLCLRPWFLISYRTLGCSLPGLFQKLEMLQVHKGLWLRRQNAPGAVAEVGQKGRPANPTCL